MRVALACGGTGGHIFPGLATGQRLRARGHEVTLWLAGKDVESTAVRDWTGPVVTVKAEGLPSAAPMRFLRAAMGIVRAARVCTGLMKQSRPDVLLAMGSYASVGPALAALRLGIPSVLHESNAVPGRAISFLSRTASAVALSFEETRAHLRNRQIRVTGMPLREALENAAGTTTGPGAGTFRILLMGGSRGARALNEIGSRALCRAHAAGARFEVIHLAGLADADTVRARYEAAGLAAEVHAFLHDVGPAYAKTHMAICRAGAATCAELLAFGIPSLLVPYPSAVRDHQTANARAMERIGAAQRIAERDLTEEWLSAYVVDAVAQGNRLDRMRKAAREHASLSAADRLADLVEEVGGGRRVG